MPHFEDVRVTFDVKPARSVIEIRADTESLSDRTKKKQRRGNNPIKITIEGEYTEIGLMRLFCDLGFANAILDMDIRGD